MIVARTRWTGAHPRNQRSFANLTPPNLVFVMFES